MALYLMVVMMMVMVGHDGLVHDGSFKEDSNDGFDGNDDGDDFRTECFVCLKVGTGLAGCQVSMVALYPAMIMMMILLIYHDI